MGAKATVAVLATCWLLGLGDDALGAAGEPDQSFGGGDGFTLLDEPLEPNESLLDVILQPDGKILGGGSRGGASGFLLARFNSDGSPDTSFGGDGIQVEPDLNAEGSPRGIAGLEEAQEGKLVAAGLGRGPGGKNAFQFARYLSNGSLDPEFGTGGMRTVPIDPFGSAHAVALAPDQGVVAVGDTEKVAVVVRVTAEGAPDAEFSALPVGVRFVDVPGVENEGAEAVDVLPNGTVLVGGGSGKGPFLAELDMNGQPVSGFGEAGIGTYDVGSAPGKSGRIEDLTVLPDGRIAATGVVQVNGGDFQAFIARFTATGELDSSFGEGGVVRRNPTAGREEAVAIEALPDERLVVAGQYGEVSLDNVGDTWVLRLTADGNLDTTFAGDGEAVLSTGLGPDQAEGLEMQPDGRAVVGGWAENPAKELMVARFTAGTSATTVERPKAAAKCAGKAATIVGTNRNDVLAGTPRADVIAALGGNDKVAPQGGNDLICGGAGAEVIKAGKGRDTLRGEGSRDILVGNQGGDRLLGGAGGDRLYGGPGNDRLLGGAGNERLVGGAGAMDLCNGGAGARDRARGGCERLKKVP